MANKPAVKSMTLEQAQSYLKDLKSQGRTESTSKEAGKVADYIATLKPEKFSDERLGEAYSKLSRGVTTGGGWTEQNLDNIEKYTGTRPQLQSPLVSGAATTGDVGSYLSSFQDSVFGSAGQPELREQITAQLEPDMAKPETLNRVSEYEKLRGQMGVVDLEKSMTDLKAQLGEQYAQKRARKVDAEGKPVAMGVIAGRVGEIERQENERIDALGRQLNVVNDQLQTSYNVISTYMNYMGLDYQDALQAYNSEFNKNLQIYNLIDSEMDEQTVAARSNLQTFQNAILGGNMSYNKLGSDQRAFISKLEAQAGLPIGFTASLKPEEKVLYNGTRTVNGVKYLDIITQGSDGRPMTKTTVLGSTSEGSGRDSMTERERLGSDTKDMNKAIRVAKEQAKNMSISFEGGGSYMTINQAKPLIESWKEDGYTEKEWWSRFGSNVYGGNPNE